tara:strand:- start:298 stop:519 length:222 start_codon:yes stop_codon:yes gene_type:complete
MKIKICDEQADFIVVDSLKRHIGYLEKPYDDPHETNDNKAHMLSALYRTLEYCATEVEYKEFVKERKDARNNL